MKLTKALLALLVASLLVATFAPAARADNFRAKRTVVTFSQPVEIPGGKVLPAGKYTIELFDSNGYRNIVRFYNADRSQLFATILAISNYRLTPTNETVMTFAERPANAPQALKAWFYPGENYGQEFVYPKARAVELAQVTHEPIPAVEKEPAPVAELKSQAVVVETPEQKEVTVAEVFPTEPPAGAHAVAAPLPETASPVPLIGLIGALSVGFAFALKRLIS
jgi:hypothetical protein